MKKLCKVTRCLRLGRNEQGRDLVVGDLHGHRLLLEQELDRLGFDPRRDRVLSVGDLIDRGPESLATLSLLDEPWFHAVLGNHELMLLNFLGYYDSRLHSRKSYPSGGGEWIVDALARDRRNVARLADAIAALPLAIHVEGNIPFNVTHGDLQPIGSNQDQLFSEESICLPKADSVTTSRDNLSAALKVDSIDLRFERHVVQISDGLLGELPITYVGHAPMRRVMVHNSYVYIDQGVGTGAAKRTPPTPPTVLDHHKFAAWLRGVALAQRFSATARAAVAA